jgi:hypothetical protein
VHLLLVAYPLDGFLGGQAFPRAKHTKRIHHLAALGGKLAAGRMADGNMLAVAGLLCRLNL